VLGHDHVAYDDKTIAPADPLQDLEKQVATSSAVEHRAALVTAGRDEVKVSGAVVTMESVRHRAFVAWTHAVSM